jgi:hypothetical protein
MLKSGKSLLLALAFSLAASAGPITYTLTTTASGTLGASSFTDALVTVTLTGDTSNVTPGTGFITGALVNPGTATVSIFGLGTATFTASIGILSTFNGTAAFLGGSGSGVLIGQFVGPLNDPTDITGILVQESPVFFGYDLRSSFGPLSSRGGSSAPDPSAVFPTTGGTLNFTAPPFDTGTTTFTAVATPEPGTLLLFGTGFVSLVGGRFRRQRLTRKTT